jgi:hypothetical protein
MSGSRADDAQFAVRVNAAADVIAAGGVTAVEAAAMLAQRFGVSTRQARRYVDRASAGRREVPEDSVVFTVKLPASVATRVRGRARASGVTISALVTQALTEFLNRSDRRGPRG